MRRPFFLLSAAAALSTLSVLPLTAQVPVVPVAIHGGRAAMRKGSHLVWPARVRIAVGEPIETRGRTLQERDQLIAETRDRIAAMLPG